MQESPTISERTMAVAALASLSAGLLVGIGARIIMRIVALTSHMPPQFSIGGTLNILFAGIILGLVAGFIIVMLTAAFSTSPKASKYLPGPIWRCLISCLLLLLLLGPPLFLSSSFPNPDITFGIPLLNKACLQR